MSAKESRQKKVLLLMAGPLRRGGGEGPGHKGKKNFFGKLFSNVPKFQRPLSSRGVGGLVPAIKRRTFIFAASRNDMYFIFYKIHMF